MLNLSKEELLWYFSHQDRIIAMVSPKTLVKSTPNSALHPTDPAIIELIYLHLQMTDVVLRHQTVVSAFYAEQFRTVYAENFNASLAEISGKFKLNADLSSIFESIRSSLMNIGKGDLLVVVEGLSMP